MESIYVRQRLRPTRYAFLVDAGDLCAALHAVSLNSALWGGICNPIVPLTPPDTRQGLLRAFDPDVLINLTGGDLPTDLAEKYQHRVLNATDVVMIDDRTNRRELGLGFTILPLLRHVHEREIRFSSGPSRAVLIAPEEVPGWPEFSAFAFGSFQWLPQTDVNFEDIFRHGLQARQLELRDLECPPDYEDLLLPVNFSRYGLRLFGGPEHFSSHVIFLGDHRSMADLIEFWNIRASGRTVVFVPIAAYRTFEPLIRLVAAQGRYPINPQIENQADLLKGPSIGGATFQEICTWVGGLGLPPLSHMDWCPRFGLQIESYVGDIYVADIEACQGEEISILQDSDMTPVKVIVPPYLEEGGLWRRGLSWAVEITMTGGSRNNDFIFSLPQEPAVEALAHRAVIGMLGEVRIGRRGIVLQQDSLGSTLQLRPVPTRDVFHALFRQVGLEAEASQPGQYAEQIIKKMGSLHGDCRVFKIRGVRAILDRLGSGSSLQKGNMRDIVLSQTSDEHGQNWRPELYNELILRYGQHLPLDFSEIFDVLLEKRIIRPGFNFRCRNCFKEDWYHVSEFAEDYTCRFCFAPQRVNFASVGAWQYKADGLFQIPDSAQGSVAVILSLWRFEDFAHGRGRYLTSQNLRPIGTKNRKTELDYAYLLMNLLDTSYELVLGQATRMGDFTDDDTRRMAELSERFARRPYLAFSTLRDRYSDADKARLRDLASRGYRVIAFTREELDPYALYNRFDQTRHKYAVTLAQVSENTLHLNAT